MFYSVAIEMFNYLFLKGNVLFYSNSIKFMGDSYLCTFRECVHSGSIICFKTYIALFCYQFFIPTKNLLFSLMMMTYMIFILEAFCNNSVLK